MLRASKQEIKDLAARTVETVLGLLHNGEPQNITIQIRSGNKGVYAVGSATFKYMVMEHLHNDPQY